MTDPAPFLKWVGGKTQLLSTLLSLFPRKVDTYYDPCLGGGSVFFALAREGRFEKAVLNDINVELMDAYRIVRDFPDDLISQLEKLPYDLDVFTQIKKADVTKFSPVRRAARTIYLNKTCFNGLYRVNKRGLFNVAFGKYTNPRIFSADVLRAASRTLGSFVQLLSVDLEEACAGAQPGDLVYLDTPYVPVTATSNFVAYAKGGFTLQDHERTAALFARLAKAGVSVVASNSAAPLVQDLYAGYHFHEVQARRSVNSKADRRGPVKEVIITSYEVPDANV